MLLASLVAVLVRSAVASGTTPPLASTTVPRTTAVFAVCAQAGIAVHSARRRTPALVILDKTFMMPPTLRIVGERSSKVQTAALGRLHHRQTREKQTCLPEPPGTACQQHTPAVKERESLKLRRNAEI